MMPTSDVWDDAITSRREAKRYRTRWKVALVFEGSTGKPIFHTLTHDLSMNGTSVQSVTDEEMHANLGLLLLVPPVDGAPQRIVKLKAVVMSSMPFRGGFRLGLGFIQNPELDKLHGMLGKLDLSGDTLPSDPEGDGLPKLL